MADVKYKNGFHWADYVIFVLTLVISMGIGIYSALTGGRQKTTKEYLMGNRQMQMVPVGLSLFMSYVSAILVIGSAAEMYQYGIQMWIQMIGSTLVIILTVHFFIPLIYPLQLTSTYEYHDLRFRSRVVRLTAVALSIITSIFSLGIVMYAPATSLEAVTNFPAWASIICTGVVGTIYTTVGGMKAVVWTDVFQCVILFGGMIAVLITGTVNVGGIHEMWGICRRAGRLNAWNFSGDPTVRMTFWSVTVGHMISNLGQDGLNQATVQRYCSLSTLWQARGTLLLSIPCLAVTYTLVCLTGLTVFAYYDKLGCDPLRAQQIGNANQLLPYYVVNVLNYPGLPGLFVAVLFSGALSTISSTLSALAAITWKDIVEPRCHIATPTRQALATKLFAFGFGCLGIGFAFVVQYLPGHVMQVSQTIVGTVAGPMAGIIILGAFFPCAGWLSAVIGAILGLAMGIWMSVGHMNAAPYRQSLPTNVSMCGNVTLAPLPENPKDVFPLYRVSYMWFGAISVGVTVFVGIIVAFFTRNHKVSDVDPRTVISAPAVFCCCLSRKTQMKCWCGVDHDSVSEVKEEQSSDETKEADQSTNGHVQSVVVNGQINSSYTPDTQLYDDNVWTPTSREKLVCEIEPPGAPPVDNYPQSTTKAELRIILSTKL